MSDISRSSRKRLRRERAKTNSDVATSSIMSINKRPLDELNSSGEIGTKRRAISATTGSENQDSSIVIIDDRQGSR